MMGKSFSLYELSARDSRRGRVFSGVETSVETFRGLLTVPAETKVKGNSNER